MTTGTPRNGPAGARSAAARALSKRGWMTALSSPFIFSMRLIAASTSSSGDASPVRTSSACAVASIAASSSVIVETVAVGSPAPQVDRPRVDDLIAVEHLHALVVRDGRVDVRG